MKQTPLTEYLKRNITAGVIDFHIRAMIVNGGVEFYIHPLNQSGETADYIIDLDPSNPEFDFIFNKHDIPAPDPSKLLAMIRQFHLQPSPLPEVPNSSKTREGMNL